ncbi:glycerol-3-phosphate acyltransferase, partial [Octadecabacter sp.]|nr:glycerol-3-phosphate acyltransferase [Octadecabacter sp.]
DFDPEGRDVVFVPVALNYDRVLEDRFLIKAEKTGVRRFRPPLFTVLWGTTQYLGARLVGRMTTFGTASVGFGKPLSLKAFATDNDGATQALAGELMTRIAGVVPAVPVPLVCRAILAGAKTEEDILSKIEKDLGDLPSTTRRPQRGAADLAADGLAVLRRRKLIAGDLVIAPVSGEEAVLEYYAASIAHHFAAGSSGEA